MDRREALKTTGVFLGGALLASSGVLEACARGERHTAIAGRVLSLEDQKLMEEIADTLLPATATSPGAKAAGAGPVINLLLTDCHEPPDHEKVKDGLAQFRDECTKRHGAAFPALSRQQREQFLREVDGEAKQRGDAHYFHLVRDLANTAYFSSEIGMTKALRYDRIPGKWVGCMPLAPGQPAWG